MKTVYIITEEGKAYSTEGHKFIANYLRNEFPQFGETGVLDDYYFRQGAILNNPKQLSKELLKDIGTVDTPGCWIIISNADGMGVLGGTFTNINNFIEDAKDNPDMTSWQIFNEELKAKNES